LLQEKFYFMKLLHFPAGKFIGLVIAVTVRCSTVFYFTHQKYVKKD